MGMQYIDAATSAAQGWRRMSLGEALGEEDRQINKYYEAASAAGEDQVSPWFEMVKNNGADTAHPDYLYHAAHAAIQKSKNLPLYDGWGLFVEIDELPNTFWGDHYLNAAASGGTVKELIARICEREELDDEARKMYNDLARVDRKGLWALLLHENREVCKEWAEAEVYQYDIRTLAFSAAYKAELEAKNPEIWVNFAMQMATA